MPGNVEYRAFTASYDTLVDELVFPATVLPPSFVETSGTDSVEIMAVLDTGATGTCIKPWLKDRLNLRLINAGKPDFLDGLGGRVKAYTALVNIQLAGNIEITNCLVSITDFPGDEDLLIGMDIIAMGDFTVCNTAGKTSFSFVVPSFPERIDLTEKAKEANRQDKV